MEGLKMAEGKFETDTDASPPEEQRGTEEAPHSPLSEMEEWEEKLLRALDQRDQYCRDLEIHLKELEHRDQESQHREEWLREAVLANASGTRERRKDNAPDPWAYDRKFFPVYKDLQVVMGFLIQL